MSRGLDVRSLICITESLEGAIALDRGRYYLTSLKHILVGEFHNNLLV